MNIFRPFILLFYVVFGSCALCDPIVIDAPLYSDSTTRAFSSVDTLTARGNGAVSMIYDAQGRAIFFPGTTGAAVSPMIIVAPGKALTLQNVTLVGFRPEHVLKQSASSTFILGDGVVISLERDLDLNSSLTFFGSVVINGNGKVLGLPGKSALIVSANSSLEVKDCVLRGLKNFKGFNGAPAASIVCAQSTGKIILNSVRCVLDSSWTFSSGVMNIAADVSFTSTWATFLYTAPGPLTIQSNSSLICDRGTTFAYASTGSQNKLVLTDSTSTLFLKNSTLTSGSLGLVLYKGALFIKGDVLFKNSAVDPKLGITIDGTLFAGLLAGSTLSLDGILAHGKAA